MTANSTKRLLLVMLAATFALASQPGDKVLVSSGQDLGTRALNVLIQRAVSIEASSRQFTSAASPVTRGAAHRFPVLEGIGAVRLRMPMDEVFKQLGKANRVEETDIGWQWTYNESGNRRLVVAFGRARTVSHLFSNSEKHRVPNELSGGLFPPRFRARLWIA